MRRKELAPPPNPLPILTNGEGDHSISLLTHLIAMVVKGTATLLPSPFFLKWGWGWGLSPLLCDYKITYISIC